jgi:hypothetical protein
MLSYFIWDFIKMWLINWFWVCEEKFIPVFTMSVLLIIQATFIPFHQLKVCMNSKFFLTWTQHFGLSKYNDENYEPNVVKDITKRALLGGNLGLGLDAGFTYTQKTYRLQQV